MVSFCLKKRMSMVLLGGVCAFFLLLYTMSAVYSSTTMLAGQPGGQPLVIQAQGNDQTEDSSPSAAPMIADGAIPTVSPQAAGNEMGIVASPRSTTSPSGSASLPALPTMPVLGNDPFSVTSPPSAASVPESDPLSTAPTQSTLSLPQESSPAQLASSSPQKNGSVQPAMPVQGSKPSPTGLLPSIGLLPAIPAQSGVQQNNQGFQGISNSGNNALLIGHNEGNTGNAGLNRGFNQDDSVDSGNQVVGQRKAIGVQANNQLITGHGGASNSGNTATSIGFDQGNSGNSGVNLGNNQDNAGNLGNQVNNQANVIGTQVNKQGTTVNNDNDVIQHQINYVNLLPNVGVYLGVRPKLEFSVSVGK